MERNDSKITPKGFESYRIGYFEKDGKVYEASLLKEKKRAFRFPVAFAIFVAILVIGLITGQISCKVIAPDGKVVVKTGIYK